LRPVQAFQGKPDVFSVDPQGVGCGAQRAVFVHHDTADGGHIQGVGVDAGQVQPVGEAGRW